MDGFTVCWAQVRVWGKLTLELSWVAKTAPRMKAASPLLLKEDWIWRVESLKGFSR